jgi:selenocysteine lyase/cysteine desulfurase
MSTRRQFLGAIAQPAIVATVAAMLEPLAIRRVLEAAGSLTGSPEEIAADESFWLEVQQAFSVDRSIINLNNGGVSPSPEMVQEAMKRYLDYSNAAPVYTMWRILEPQRETVRQRLARLFGCDGEEIAVTRNASEGLLICQLGFDLKRGDEVLTTNQDYPRMINTFKQRERREGIVLKQFSIPVPCENDDEIVKRFEENITSKTRLLLISHMINVTGQILPVKPVVQMARKKDIPVIVDGAHSFAHFDFNLSDLDCDYFATSLHKWLFAPHGSGMLFVKKEKIGGLWPMMPAPDSLTEDIRKFEEIGTHPAANFLAIGQAVTFHEGIGAKRKAARMILLRDRWARRLLQHERVRLHTSLEPGFACGLATVQIASIDSIELSSKLWSEHRILVTPIKHGEFEGIRVTPNLYTTLEELDYFCDAVENIIKKG